MEKKKESLQISRGLPLVFFFIINLKEQFNTYIYLQNDTIHTIKTTRMLETCTGQSCNRFVTELLGPRDIYHIF